MENFQRASETARNVLGLDGGQWRWSSLHTLHRLWLWDLCVDVAFAEKRGFVIGWGSDQLSSSIISPFPLKIFKFLGFVSDQDSENLLTNHTDDPTKAISFSSFILPVSSSTSNFHSRSYMLLFRGWLLHFMAFVFPSVLDEISNVLLLRRRFSISPRVRREEKIIFTLTFEDGRRGKAFKRNLDEEIMARSRPFRLFHSQNLFSSPV